MSVWTLSKIAHTDWRREPDLSIGGDSGTKKTATPDDGGRAEGATLIVTEPGEQFCSDPLGH